MYKTVRHGENSLQYTILPQNDDFRIEGKLTSAENSCSSSTTTNTTTNTTTGRKPKTKRPKRRSCIAYLGLIFVCTVIIGAVLIPFLVSAECLPNPTDWFLSKNNIDRHDKPPSALGLKGGHKNVHINFIGSGINLGKTVKIINQAGVEKIVLRTNKTSNNVTESQNINTISKYQNNNQNESIVVNVQEKNAKDDEEKPLPTSNPTSSMINVQLNVKTENQESLNNNNNGMDMKAQNFENLNQNQNPILQTNAQLKGDRGTVQMQAQTDRIQNLNKNFEFNPPNQEHFITEVRFEPVKIASSKPPNVIPTIVVTTLRNQYNNDEVAVQQQQQPQQQQKQQFIVQSQTAPNVRPTTTLSNSAFGSNNGYNSTASTSSLVTRIIQVPLLKAAAKKPIIPPVLVKTNSQLNNANNYGSTGNENSDLATSLPLPPQTSSSDFINTNPAETQAEPAKANDWIHAHWPFVDPSTYFQWTGYKAEDSVLLPALLGFALIGMILSITVCLVVRNKYTIVSSVRKRNRNVSDLEGNGAEDNTTLLTSANLSDED